MIALYVFGILMGILAALVLEKTAFRGRPVPFVMELPNYRLPSVKSVALLLWEKAKDFLERAFTVIFLATIVIWFLQSFDTRLNVVESSADSLLAMIGQFLAPIFAPLGFADWRCATALISGFIAKESVVSTLEILLGTSALSGAFHNKKRRELSCLYTSLYPLRRGHRSHSPGGRLAGPCGNHRAVAVLRGISGGVCDVRDPEFIGVCDGSSDFSAFGALDRICRPEAEKERQRMRLRLPGLHEGKRALQKINMHLPCPA